MLMLLSFGTSLGTTVAGPVVARVTPHSWLLHPAQWLQVPKAGIKNQKMIQTGEKTNLYENICRTFSIHSLHTFCSCNMIRPKENYGDRVLFIFFDVFLCFFVSTSGKTCDTFCCVAVFCLA